MKQRRICSLLLCLCMVLTLLPATALEPETTAGESQSAPTVSFHVQNTDVAVGTVQYKIGTGDWTSLTLALAGDALNQYLSGTITDTLHQNDTIYLKATPASGYEMDSARGVAVWVDGNNTAISGGTEAIITDSGLSYTLNESKNYEFEFGFQSAGSSGGESQSAPTVSFRVQNTDMAVGTVQYKIGTGNWTSLTLALAGDAPNQYLSGTITDTLHQNDTIYLKATPASGYEMDSVRGVAVWVDGNNTAISGGAEAIITDSGLSYTLNESKNYEFEFGFQSAGSPGGGNEPNPSGDTYTITASAGENGSIDPSGVQYVDEGQGRQFTFSPDNGYEVDEVLVDGVSVPVTEPQYGFTDVQGNHTISVSFKLIQGTPGDAAAAKEKIEGRRWAYGGVDAAAIEAAFEAELFDMAVHEFSGVFESAGEVADAVTLKSQTTSTDSSEFCIFGTTLCPYYTFDIALGGNDAAVTVNVYVLDNLTDYVVTTTDGDTPAFTIVSGEDCVVNRNYDTLGVFGNGAAIEGRLGSGENYAAFHVTTRAGLGADTFKLTIYKTDFVGSAVTISDSYKAAAWGFAQAKIAEFSSSDAAPSEFEVYFANSSVTLSASGLSDIGIQALVDVTAPSLPVGAVTITNSGDGASKAFTISFHSNYYDEIPLTITYKDRTNAEVTAYLTLKRVGIDIQAYQKSGDSNGSYNTNHGTDPGLQDQSWGDDNYAVYASYYYPTTFGQNEYAAPNENVELYVTYTWANGSVTRQTLSQAVRTNGDANSVPIDDFLLYKGAADSAPAKIEVTAVKTGSDGTTFAGASLGSGAGVVWVCPDSPRT